MDRRSFEVGRSRALAWVAVVSFCAAGACAAVEGLDEYQTCETACFDASVSPGGDGVSGEGATVSPDGQGAANDGSRTGDQVAADAAAPPPDGGAPGDGGDSATTRDSGGADASCACVPAAPSGWTGYVQIALGDAGAPPCVAPYDHGQGTKKTSPTGAPPQCTPCACAPPASGPIQCQVSLGSQGALCAGETMTVAPAGLCVLPPAPMGITSGPNGDSYGPTMLPAPSGSCSPGGGALSQPLAAAQSVTASVCATTEAPGARCPAAGDVCLPTPHGQAGAPAGVCISQSGVQSCPAGLYTVRVVVADALVDTRGCAACACAAPACPADGYVQGYRSIDCSGGPAATFNASTACVLGNNADASVSFKYFPSHSAWTQTCAVTAGGPAGGVALDTTSATTFCCMP